MNRRRLVWRLFLTCLSLVTGGQWVCEAQQKVSTEEELMGLERTWSAAYLRHDANTIDRILADDYVGIDGRAIVTDKAQEIEDAKPPAAGAPSPQFVLLNEEITDMRVRVYGNAAVVTGISRERVRSGSEESSVLYRRTTVWVKKKQDWQCVSFHATRMLDRQPGTS
jgi:ketosteroid isomerase-like protein